MVSFISVWQLDLILCRIHLGYYLNKTVWFVGNRREAMKTISKEDLVFDPKFISEYQDEEGTLTYYKVYSFQVLNVLVNIRMKKVCLLTIKIIIYKFHVTTQAKIVHLNVMWN